MIPPNQIPACFKHVWGLWLEVYIERDHGFGVQPLKIRDIIAWSTAVQINLLPIEIECLQLIDREFVGGHKDGISKPTNQGKE